LDNRSQQSQGLKRTNSGGFFGEHGPAYGYPRESAPDPTAALKKQGWRPFGRYWYRGGEFKPLEELLAEQKKNEPINKRYAASDKEVDVWEKQAQDAEDDLGAIQGSHAKDETIGGVARLEQSRAKGQTFPTDKPPRTVRGVPEQGYDSDHEFLEGKAGAKAWRKANKF